MTPPAGISAGTVEDTAPVDVRVRDWHSRLWRICLSALSRFHSRETGILVRTLTWNGESWVPSAPSAINTANALVALYALRRAGYEPPLPPDPMLERIVSTHLAELDYPSVACALWADALGRAAYTTVLWQKLQRSVPRDASQSLHLAWVLAALCGCEEARPGTHDVRRLADWTYARIAANQSNATGLFHGSALREGWLRRRRPLSTLSSQTYPAFALARYGRVFGVPEAVARSARCADALCRLQGPDGQWWRRYDVRTGDVVERHPVYAVNQDAAIPLAFRAIDGASSRYEPHIARGLAWLFGNNELDTPLVDEAHGVVWPAIAADGSRFTVARETHSYHPARCLLALLSAQARPAEVAG